MFSSIISPDALPVLAAMVPFVGAIACVLFPRHNPAIANVSGAAALVVSLVLVATLADTGIEAYALGGWVAPLGIELAPSGLGAILVVLTAVLMLACQLTASDLLRSPGFAPSWLFAWSSLVVVFVSRDLFNLYVGLELLSISAVALVLNANSRVALRAGLNYLLAGLMGSALFLFGVALVYGSTGSLAPEALAAIESPLTRASALALMSAGILVKGAVFPVHGWLPQAHGVAPAAASAVLSGIVVKAGFFLLWTLWGGATGFGVDALQSGANVIGGLGVLALTYGSVMAYRAPRLKLVVAYSTVAQVGYLAITVPLLVHAPQAALAAGTMLIGGHALAKAGCFLAVGAVLKQFGHDRIGELNGTVSHAPIAVFALAAGAVCLVGLPPTGGFMGKWMLLEISLLSQTWFWLVALIVGSAASAAAFTRALAGLFIRDESISASGAIPATPNAPAAWIALSLALAGCALGLVAGAITELVNTAGISP
jgi:multicomponent Na+:H+ antiporter subunit D